MHLEGWFIVRGLLGVFEATTLVDGDVHEDGTLLHFLYGLLTHQLRCGSAWNKHGANDKVGFLQFLIDGGRIRNQGAHATGVLIIEALQNVRIQVEHGDLGTQTMGHGNGGRANLAAADHDDACWLGTRNSRNQQAAATLRGEQVVGALDCSEATCHLGHRSKKWQRTVAVSNRLIGDGSGIGLNKRLSQGTIRGKVQVGKDGKVRTQVLVLRLERLLDLQQQFRLRPSILRGSNDAGTGGLVLRIREGCALTSTGLDEDLVAVVNEGLRAARGKSHAVLVIHDFFRHSNTHYTISLRVE